MMEFSDTKPISRQLEDYCRMRISSGDWPADARIPSTKELAVRLGVNPRTVMKAYDSLAAEGAIYQKRGMGYYVSAEGSGLLLETRRREFMTETLPELARTMRELGIDADRVAEELRRLLSSES